MFNRIYHLFWWQFQKTSIFLFKSKNSKKKIKNFKKKNSLIKYIKDMIQLKYEKKKMKICFKCRFQLHFQFSSNQPEIQMSMLFDNIKLEIGENNTVSCGYREFTMEYRPEMKTLNFHKNVARFDTNKKKMAFLTYTATLKIVLKF